MDYTGNVGEPSSDLDWGEVENFGTDIEVGQFLQNHEETQGYEELQIPTDVEVFKISRKTNRAG